MNFLKTPEVDHIRYYQNTIRDKVSFSGVGLHNGKAVDMKLIPAKENTGIVFRRVDVKKNNTIKVNSKNIVKRKFCSKITNNYGIYVETVEHLMSALKSLFIDNLVIEINSSELPAMDGSSYEYVIKILQIGRKVQTEPRKYLKIRKQLIANIGNRWIQASPSDKLNIDLEINYPNTMIGNERYNYTHDETNFVNQICYARTFTLAKDVDKLRASGFGLGGNLNNAIVVDKNKVLNKNGLKCKHEFIKHKVLDCIGDLYLSGYQIIGNIKSYAPGHELNFEIIREIFSCSSNFEISDLDNLHSLPIRTEINSTKLSLA